MKRLLIVFVLLTACAANGQVELEIALAYEREILELTFKNTGEAEKKLEVPVEGSGDCDKYFRVEAIREGKEVQRRILYAPLIPPFVVTLKPGGIYRHRIKPHAYLGGTNVQEIEKLRMIYMNPIDDREIVSDWLRIDNNFKDPQESFDEANSSETIKKLVLTDRAFPKRATVSHPLICVEGGDYPNGVEMLLRKKNDDSKWIHAVFPEDVKTPDKELVEIELKGFFQEIQKRERFEHKKQPPEDYQYFVVTSWEYNEAHPESI